MGQLHITSWLLSNQIKNTQLPEIFLHNAILLVIQVYTTLTMVGREQLAMYVNIQTHLYENSNS